MSLEGMAICRRVSDGRTPGSIIGFECRVCHVALQATPHGAQKIRAGEYIPICQTCGLTIAQSLAAAGDDLEVRAHPVALEQAQRKPHVVPDGMRRYTMTCEYCREPVKLGEAHQCPGKGASA